MADRRLQVFQAVAKHLSFTKAAEALSMTQPAVTFQIRQLEEHFTTRLFDRAHGSISLTEAGKIAFDYAERIGALTAELDTRVRQMSDQLAGPLLLGASTTVAEYLLPRILGEFKSRYPAVVPRLFVANSEAVQSRVAERSLDLGFIEGDSHLPSLTTDLCCEDELQIVCTHAHPLALSKTVTPQSLIGHAYVSREPGSGTREVIQRYLQQCGVAPDALPAIMEAGSPEALKGLIATGVGFGIMSRITVNKEIRLGELVQIPLSPRLLRQFSGVYPKERFHSRVVNTFVAFMKQQITAMRASAGPPAGG
jgi:DNA-binding transcriptional LysR family regulator